MNYAKNINKMLLPSTTNIFPPEGLHNIRGSAPGVARNPGQKAPTRLLPLNHQPASQTKALLKVQPVLCQLAN